MSTTYFIAVVCIDILWLAWAILWLVLAFRTKRTVFRQPFRQRLAYLGFGIVFGIMVSQVPWIWLTPNVLLEAAGVALCAAGMAFTFWARFTLGRNWSGFVTLKEDHQLIESGPYRYVRHPIYTGLLVAVLGTDAAIFPSLHGLLLLAFLAAALTFKLRQEEKLMLRQFPEAYPAYKSRVRAALVPFLF